MVNPCEHCFWIDYLRQLNGYRPAFLGGDGECDPGNEAQGSRDALAGCCKSAVSKVLRDMPPEYVTQVLQTFQPDDPRLYGSLSAFKSVMEPETVTQLS